MRPARVGDDRRPVRAVFSMVLALQVFLGVWGVADQWTRGHNGWNGAAYHNAARNTLRWGVWFPLQYDTANTPPDSTQLYTHAPLGLHLNNVLSLKLFGDREVSIRLVAAFWSIAALVMLFAVVRRLWDDDHAIAASAIYVALPINAIYTNMANHTAGFIFWSLLALYLYLRAPRDQPWPWARFAGFGLAVALAAMWDWPAYYLAACIAAHWGFQLIAKRGNPGGPTGTQWLAFCAWVLLLFAAHAAMVEAATGSLDELTDTFNARRALSWSLFRLHLWLVPELMFTWPILGLTVAWIGAAVVRSIRGRGHSRDLLPLGFIVGGIFHYLTFRWSAVLHSYWAWPLLPGVAVAVAAALVGTGRFIAARAGGLTALSILVLVLPLALRVVEMVPEGRRVGGSMWFFTPVRGVIEPYDSGRFELRFARLVKAWTDRETGVQLHTSLQPRQLEPRFDITLDRVTHRWVQQPRSEIPNRRGASHWVFIAAVDAFSIDERARFAARHPYRQYGDYFMVDLRTEAQDIKVWDWIPVSSGLQWWLFKSSWEPPVRGSRLVGEEQRLGRYGTVGDAL